MINSQGVFISNKDGTWLFRRATILSQIILAIDLSRPGLPGVSKFSLKTVCQALYLTTTIGIKIGSSITTPFRITKDLQQRFIAIFFLKYKMELVVCEKISAVVITKYNIMDIGHKDNKDY